MRCYNHFKNKNERERNTHENLAVARCHTGVSLMPMRRITLHDISTTPFRRSALAEELVAEATSGPGRTHCQLIAYILNGYSDTTIFRLSLSIS